MNPRDANGLCVHKVGALAYLETMCFGLIPCRVTDMHNNSADNLSVTLTASRGKFATYRKGEVIACQSARHVIPRHHIRRWGGQYYVTPNYVWTK